MGPLLLRKEGNMNRTRILSKESLRMMLGAYVKHAQTDAIHTLNQMEEIENYIWERIEKGNEIGPGCE